MDKTYFSAERPARLRERGLVERIAQPGIESGARQTVLETFHRLGTIGEGIEQFRMVVSAYPYERTQPSTGVRAHLSIGLIHRT
ncbi:hypothetical protein ABZZ04_29515 [Streptomyces sp. NPDC006435]|uniref:hypothetical protein n=1 Tax=Streptomyces sp. NPDC006435 TaxID=3154300 RepID=UPI0033B4DDD3